MTDDVRNDGDDEISLLDIALTLKDNLRLLVAGPVVVGVAVLGITFFITPSYTAKTQFLPPQQGGGGMAAAMLQGLGALGGLAGSTAGLKNPADQYIAFLKSNSVERQLVNRFKLKERYKEDFTVDAINSLESKTKISSGKDGLISIEFDDKDPNFAAQLANAYVEELGKLLDRIAVTESQQRRKFFEDRLLQTKHKLIAAQTTLQASGFKEGALRAEPRAAAEAYAELKAKVTEAQVRLQSMQGSYTNQAPEYKLAQAQYRALAEQLVKAEDTNSANETDDYISKYREFKYQETLFELFAKQFELAKVDEAKEGALIQVVDVAHPPEKKSKPRKAMFAVVSTLAAGFGLLCFVFVRQAWRNAKKDPDFAEKINR